MELQTTILSLRTEAGVIDQLIAGFEQLAKLRSLRGGEPTHSYPGKRRGRKGMSATERQEVSERMKRYWASRRKRSKEGRPADAQK